MRTIIRLAVTVFAFLVGMTAVHVQAAEGDWPIRIDNPNASILVYQPQVETFTEDKLTGRTAVSITKTGETEPVFGAMWIDARVQTDRDTRMVSILEAKVTRVRFAEATEEKEKQLGDIIEKEIPQWDLFISLDRLLTGLDLAERQEESASALKFDPPVIIFADEPTVLVTIDGEPQLSKVEGSDQMLVVNTPFLLALDTKSKRYYLDGGDLWYAADSATGPWEVTDSVPEEILSWKVTEEDEGDNTPPDEADSEETPVIEEDDASSGDADSEEDPVKIDTRVPKVIVATEPTELIVSDGKPEFEPIEGTGLKFMSNTDSDVLLQVDTQRHYALLSGRWYAADSMEGPWILVPSDQLPPDMANIPTESDMGHVLTFVPETEEANEAILDNQIPQTSVIDRNTTTLTVTYDGEPEFKKVEGTTLQYAVNTSDAVFMAGSKYYACRQAVWFVANSPTGTWKVADEVHEDIYTIPPSCPHYNVRYVYIFGSTPEVVYVGYTQGYLGSYVYGGTIVYGTGYFYPGWYRTVYYANPYTWGFHARWNRWYGWSFGSSYSSSRFTLDVYYGGWWGPGGWRGYRRGYYRGYRRGSRSAYQDGYRAGRQDSHRKENLYERAQNRERNAERSGMDQRKRPQLETEKKNNVFADRSGNVYRNTESGWQKRGGGQWSKADIGRDTKGSQNQSSAPSYHPTSKPSGQERGGSGLERDNRARQRGSQRTSSYRRSSGRSRGGGGRSRGGGGRSRGGRRR